jgi:hypothetical protein
MFSGGVYIVEFKNEEVKRAFYEWAKKGNEKHAKSEIALMGLQANFKEIGNNKHILTLEHNLFFNFSFVLKLIFILMGIKRRKFYTIKTASTIDLINFIEVLECRKKES